MLTPEIKAQVQAVLRARQLQDKAYRAVMDITHDTPLEVAEQLVEEHGRMIRAAAREEYRLVQLTIKASETVTT